jgi:ribosome-associated heat shock protein Hsp15
MGFSGAGTEREVAVRIDKWLWAARFYRTRSMAADAVERGQVRVAEQRVKPARVVKLGDAILVQRGDERIECVVRGLSGVRGPAAVAQSLYEETAESRERRMRRAETRRDAREPAASIKGRPSKRDGRELRRLAGKARVEEGNQ